MEKGVFSMHLHSDFLSFKYSSICRQFFFCCRFYECLLFIYGHVQFYWAYTLPGRYKMKRNHADTSTLSRPLVLIVLVLTS